MTEDFFTRLRAANVARLPQFKNKQGEPAHEMPDGSDWPNILWINATLGELGEASNIIKKMVRGDYGLLAQQGRDDLGKELADVLTYLDITAFRYNLPGLVMALSSPVKINSNFPMASHSLGIMEALSFLSMGETGGVKFTPEGQMDVFATAVFHLNEIARLNDLSLKAITISKFNEVSERVGSTVRL